MDYSAYHAEGASAIERFVPLSDGVELRVIEFTPAGGGLEHPPVLFVAGWISLISGWQGLLQSLTEKYRVHYLETREKGSSKMSSPKDVAFTMERMKTDVKEVVDALYGDAPYLLSGSSLGASAILEFLMSAKRAPQKTVLIAPNPELKFPKVLMYGLVSWFPPAFYWPIREIAKWYLRNFRLDPVNEPEQYAKYANTLDEADPYKLKPNVWAMLDYQMWDRLSLVKDPCLIVGADSDKLHGLDNLQRMIQLMPNAELVAMESNKATHSEQAGDLLAAYFSKI